MSHSPPTCLGDTWVWDGATWTEVNLDPTAPKPDRRCNPSMVYVPTQERVVLFGGETPDVAFQDPRAWNETAWALAALSGSPPASRFAHAMAYDGAQDTLFMVGDSPRYVSTFQDSCLYDDTNPVRQGYWTIDAYRDPISTEPCYWHYRYDRRRSTPGQPCGKLVVFFSTSLQVCDEP